MFDKNWFPSPSPFDAPFTSPAISTNSTVAPTVLSGLTTFSKSFKRGSGTLTSPTFGSIVANG